MVTDCTILFYGDISQGRGFHCIWSNSVMPLGEGTKRAAHTATTQACQILDSKIIFLQLKIVFTKK